MPPCSLFWACHRCRVVERPFLKHRESLKHLKHLSVMDKSAENSVLLSRTIPSPEHPKHLWAKELTGFTGNGRTLLCGSSSACPPDERSLSPWHSSVAVGPCSRCQVGVGEAAVGTCPYFCPPQGFGMSSVNMRKQNAARALPFKNNTAQVWILAVQSIPPPPTKCYSHLGKPL